MATALLVPLTSAPGQEVEPQAQPQARPQAHAVQMAVQEPVQEYSKPLRQAILDLPVAEEKRTGYARSEFTHWVDADSDRCDTREEVLLAESTSKAQVGSGCAVRRGRWVSYYDRVVVTVPSRLDIDHMVPLAEAWDSGASTWTAATREAFANDLGDPRALVAVTAGSNRAKSDADPAHWLPRYDRCRYLREWTAVKLRWRLTVDTPERAALARLAGSCPNRALTLTRATVSKPSSPPAARGVALAAIADDPAGQGGAPVRRLGVGVEQRR